jgi:hypothetical protein
MIAAVIVASLGTPSIRDSSPACSPKALRRLGRMAKRPTSIMPRMMSMWRLALRGLCSRRAIAASAREKYESASGIATIRVDARPAA